MRGLQQDFCIKLHDLFERRVEVWFLDECSTHFWERRSKLWMDLKRPFFLPLRYKRGAGCAILGAISTQQPRMVWRVAGKSNAHEVKLLCHLVAAQCLDCKNAVVVLDKASYHRNPAVKAYLESKGIGVLYLPSSSSALSSVETAWAIFKRRFGHHLTTLAHEELRNAELVDVVKSQLRLFCDTYDGSVIAQHCFKEMTKVMEGVRV